MKQPPQTVEISERVKHPMRRAIYEMVARIPFGRVATYGQIATLAGYLQKVSATRYPKR